LSHRNYLSQEVCVIWEEEGERKEKKGRIHHAALLVSNFEVQALRIKKKRKKALSFFLLFNLLS